MLHFLYIALSIVEQNHVENIQENGLAHQQLLNAYSECQRETGPIKAK